VADPEIWDRGGRIGLAFRGAFLVGVESEEGN